jgi:hypothetical protein
MAAVTFTAAQVKPVFPDHGRMEAYDGIAAETITAGQPVFWNSSGKLELADANAAGEDEIRGIAITGGGAGTAITYIKRGAVYGFSLSGAYDSLVYLSNTVGTYEDSGTIIVGRVMPLSDGPTPTKVLYVDIKWNEDWS